MILHLERFYWPLSGWKGGMNGRSNILYPSNDADADADSDSDIYQNKDTSPENYGDTTVDRFRNLSIFHMKSNRMQWNESFDFIFRLL